MPKNMIRKLILALPILVVSSPMYAAVLNFYDDAATDTTLRFSVSCTLGCEGALFDGTPSTFSVTKGDLIPFPGGGGIFGVVNGATGESYATQTEIDRGGAEVFSFFSSAEYISIKVGGSPDFGLIKNLAAGNYFTFTKLITGPASGTGLSHTREFGRIPDVPLPATGLMLLAGIGGLLGSRKLKKS